MMKPSLLSRSVAIELCSYLPSLSRMDVMMMKFFHQNHTEGAGLLMYNRRRLSISRMLDMGGAPSSMSDQSPSRIVNVSKKCKVQAICFDFNVLIRSSQEEVQSSSSSSSHDSRSPTGMKPSGNDEVGNTALGQIRPNMTLVQQVADLLSVSLGQETKHTSSKTNKDDLSLITSTTVGRKQHEEKNKQNSDRSSMWSPSDGSNSSFGSDVRNKYLSKLASKGMIGGLASVEQNRQEFQDGDAKGHLAARQMAVLSPPPPTGPASKWLALSGTGNLLQYLTHRSLKIVLLPNPTYTNRPDDQTKEGQDMDDFCKQLKDVVIDLLIKVSIDPLKICLQQVLSKFQWDDPRRVLVVSDRDDYIRVAKDEGMVTCRIQRQNSPRGNVSAHYTVNHINDVKDVVNEINGISFNAVLKGR